jgi:hypothetical protein
MTTENDDTTTDESLETNVTLRQRARAERAFRKVREMDNPFAALAVDLYEQGATAEETYRQYARVEAVLGDASMAEQTELIPEWKITVKVPDDTPSGYRYETMFRAHQDPRKAEAEVEETTGREVVSGRTEQVGYIEVA